MSSGGASRVTSQTTASVGDFLWVDLNANGVQDPTSSQVADAGKTGALLLRLKRGDAYFYAALKKASDARLR